MDESYDYESEALKTKVFPNNIEQGDEDGLEWKLSIKKEIGDSGQEKITFVWSFNWEDMRRYRRIIGWKGIVMAYLWNKDRYMWTGPHEFDVEFFGSEGIVRKELERDMEQCYSTDGTFWFKHGFELEPLFQRKTKLIVEGREINVNRKILVKNSTYFAELFRDSERTDFPIENVLYENMKNLVGLFHSNPVIPRVTAFPKLLELSEVFKLPSVRLLAEFHILMTDEIPLDEKIEIADKYKLDKLFEQSISSLKSIDDVKMLVENSNFTDGVKSKLFDRMMSFSQ